MKNFQLFWVIIFSAIFFQRGYSGPASTVTEDPDDWEDDDDSSEADDDGRVYKNPRNFPSPDCPRDEIQATILGQKCLRKCSSSEDCKSKKKQCLCDGACGRSCIKPDRECPELEHPSLGTVVMSGRTFGSRASYTCNHGYHVVGLQTRTCQAYGHWSGSEPACKQNIYCLAPPTIEHARHSALPEQATFDLDSTVQYHCHLGYATAGFPRAKCLAIDGQASWYGPDISCEPRSCGQPADPAHGWHAGECYTYGCRITYHCGDGYELVGKQAADCQADGTWSAKEIPTCVLVTAVQCPLPDNPRNGKAIYTSVSYNSVVSYECRYGYTLLGESSRRCGADKKWSGGLPQCKEINCGHPGSLYNGWLENTETGFGLGASIIFRCQPEMLLIGNTSTVCQIDGRWRYPSPLCLAPCVVPTVSQGIVVPIEIEVPDQNTTQPPMSMGIVSSKVRHGTILEVICDEHYEFPLTSLSPPTCNNGTWTTIPRCVPARCKTLPKAPKFGMVISPKTEHGMKARFRCKDGWQLATADLKPINDSSEHVLTCSFGNWTGEFPICQEVYCQYPGMIDNGKVLLVGNMGLYDYRPYVKKVINNKQIMYDCDKGYVLENGPSGATCIGGKWQPPELPQCLLGQHPRLRWNRKKRSIDIRFARSKFLQNHYRNIKRKHFDHHMVDDFVKKASTRKKRSLNYYDSDDDYNHIELLNDIVRGGTKEKRKRENRDYAEIDRAYSKYYEKIKARYRNYVKTLFSNQRPRNSLINNSYPMQPVGTGEEDMRNTKKIQVQDGRWFNNPEYRYRAIHKARSFSNDLQSEDPDTIQPVAIPNINDQTISDNQDAFILPNVNLSAVSNYYPSYSSGSNNYYSNNTYSNYYPDRNIEEPPERELKKQHSPADIAANIYAQLQSQIVRKKRETDDDGKDDDTGTAGGGKKKNRGPCEPLLNADHMQIEIVKQAKNPNESFGHGMVLKITCDSGYNSNVQTANSTVRCNKGNWKPVKPSCSLRPCFVPSIEHGKYYEMPSSDPVIEQIRPTTSPLVPMDKIDSGLSIAFQCDSGYNIQGANSIKCIDGNWSSLGLPECLPAPCVLPEILHAVYQGGYREGLTIAHGSHVMVQCENGAANTIPAVQMDCALGSLTPQTMSCSYTASKKMNEDEDHMNFIIDDGNSTSSDEEGDCPPPSKEVLILIYKNEDLIENEEMSSYPSGTEISFSCIPSITGERTTWKIVCEQGHWIGRAHDCEDDERLYNTPLANGSCLFKNTDPHVVSFYNDLEIRENYVEFPAGTTIISRCVDIGKYMMVGSSNRTCIRSRFTGQKPHCYGLNQENDYAMEKAPTILFRHQNGPIAQSNDGRLIVYPGTTLHMECLWMRRFGTPKWNVSQEFRKYPEGWNTDEGRDSQLEYRLSIFTAETGDTGVYSCHTPARHTHSVLVEVKAVHCGDIMPRRGLVLSTTATQMGTKVQFSCNNGNALIGTPEIACLASGNWSSPLPICESVECGEVPIPPSLNGSAPRVAIISREVGGRAAFSCPPGHGLKGPSETICLPSGEWGGPIPTCSEVQCFHPGQPANGYTQGTPPYKAGDVVQFNCNPEYMMQGQPIIACQDNARWSGPVPKCVRACSYPGTAISGRMSSVKFYYAIGETVIFSCDNGLEIRGPKMLKCMKDGKWSSSIPVCVSPEAEASSSAARVSRAANIERSF